MITHDEMQSILHELGLDYEAEPSMIYLFIERPDGRIDNFSIGVRRGRELSDSGIVDLMHREYPATRQAAVVAMERPQEQLQHDEWLTVRAACDMLQVSARTLRNWAKKGYVLPHIIGGRVYYSHSQIDRLLKSNIVQENGRIDKSGAAEMNEKLRQPRES